MGRYEAVLFDWMLTLADYPSPGDHVRAAFTDLGREVTHEELDALVQRLGEALDDPEVRGAYQRVDCSAELHRRVTTLHFERAGIDDELAEAMYRLLGDPALHPLYPQTAAVLAAVREHGVSVAVVSDIHVDLRAHAALNGIGHLIDAWVLSYEHGIQKPDVRMFELALDALRVDPTDALMVGDRASHDGAAATLGIDTLILPARGTSVPGAGLPSVLRLLG